MENKILALLSSFILKPRLRVFTQSDEVKDLAFVRTRFFAGVYPEHVEGAQNDNSKDEGDGI